MVFDTACKLFLGNINVAKFCYKHYDSDILLAGLCGNKNLPSSGGSGLDMDEVATAKGRSPSKNTTRNFAPSNIVFSFYFL